MCGSEPGTGQQLKEMFYSPDAGRTWSKPRNAPSSGYVEAILATTSSDIWFSLHRDAPLMSIDKGIHWKGAGILTNDDYSGFGRFHFVDPFHGWVSNYNTVFRTVNGGRSWSRVILGPQG
jgi:photosystem II stability/assembly factor-like uncharacterized protein